MSVEIKVGQSGSCPHDLRGVSKVKDNEYIVYPQWREVPGRGEESVSGWGARFEIKLVNKSKKARKVILHVDWQFPSKDRHWVKALRDFAYLKRNGVWKMILPERIDGSVVTFVLDVPAGESDIAQYPAYNLPELNKDLKAWERKGAVISNYGKSAKKLVLPLIAFNSKENGKEKVILLIRNHAYETAGSYCCRGIVNFLLGGSDMAGYLLSRFSFRILPMTNIDGVEYGMSRLTSPQGANLNRYNTAKDSSFSAMLKLIEEQKPELVMNYHNWQYKFKDGMWCKSEHYQKMIMHYLSDIYLEHKRMDPVVVFKKEFNPGFERASLHDYLENKFGSTTVTYEFPWFGRTTERMEELGERSFIAFLLARIEEVDGNTEG